jgi:hypothetical protein
METTKVDKTTLPHIWFCDTCRKKGRMPNKNMGSLGKALTQHGFATPNCLGNVRSVPESEADTVPGVRQYTEWYE